MDNLIYFLKENLYLNNFNILKTGKNKCVIFKVSYKYTKCIYIKIKDDIINKVKPIVYEHIEENQEFYKGKDGKDGKDGRSVKLELENNGDLYAIYE